MIRCNLTRKKLCAFQAGELSEPAAQGVRDHLSTCSRCEQERLTLERLMNKLDRIRPIEPSPGFEAAFRRKLREAGTREAETKEAASSRARGFAWALPRGWQWGMGLSSAAGLVLLAAAYLFWGAVQFPEMGGGFTKSVEMVEISEEMEFYQDLELLEQMGDFVGPELPKDAQRNGTS
ncbi:MAG TPA: zf-HC2 domain-containing protein [Nitrospiria bacterium]